MISDLFIFSMSYKKKFSHLLLGAKGGTFSQLTLDIHFYLTLRIKNAVLFWQIKYDQSSQEREKKELYNSVQT